MRKTALIVAAGLIAAAAIAGSPAASAHVSAQTYGSAPTSGSYGQVFLRVPHGCAGDATSRFEVRIPDGVTRVKPQAIPGWSVHAISDAAGVRTVTWSGGSLADGQFADFGLSVKWPELDPGEQARDVYFPAVQHCDADLTVTRSGGVAAITGKLPGLEGKQVGLFSGTQRLANVIVGADGNMSTEVPGRKAPRGTEVTAKRAGQQVGTSAQGTQAWVQVPGTGQDPHDLAYPAPSVSVAASHGAGGH